MNSRGGAGSQGEAGDAKGARRGKRAAAGEKRGIAGEKRRLQAERAQNRKNWGLARKANGHKGGIRKGR